MATPVPWLSGPTVLSVCLKVNSLEGWRLLLIDPTKAQLLKNTFLFLNFPLLVSPASKSWLHTSTSISGTAFSLKPHTASLDRPAAPGLLHRLPFFSKRLILLLLSVACLPTWWLSQMEDLRDSSSFLFFFFGPYLLCFAFSFPLSLPSLLFFLLLIPIHCHHASQILGGPLKYFQ